MSKAVATKACTIHVYQNADGDVSGFNVQVQTPPSTKVKADGNGVYKGSVSVMLMAGCTCADGYTLITPVNFTLQATGKPKVEGDKIMLVNTKAKGQGTGKQGDSTKPEMFTCEIVNAGQTKVTAEEG